MLIILIIIRFKKYYNYNIVVLLIENYHKDHLNNCKKEFQALPHILNPSYHSYHFLLYLHKLLKEVVFHIDQNSNNDNNIIYLNINPFFIFLYFLSF